MGHKDIPKRSSSKRKRVTMHAAKRLKLRRTPSDFVLCNGYDRKSLQTNAFRQFRELEINFQQNIHRRISVSLPSKSTVKILVLGCKLARSCPMLKQFSYGLL